MFDIDADLISTVARLSQMGLSPAEAKAIRADLESILGHFQAIQDVDTEGVEPLAHVLSAHGEAAADEVQPFAAAQESRESLLPLSAHHREGFFVVPRVLAGPDPEDSDDATGSQAAGTKAGNKAGTGTSQADPVDPAEHD